MKTKKVTINGTEITLLKYKKVWVFPYVAEYTHSEHGSPIAILFYEYANEELEYYCDVTVNLPDGAQDTNCQYINTNNNGADMIDWLIKNRFGYLTGRIGKSEYCSYPEFNFSKGEKFWEYKELCKTFEF